MASNNKKIKEKKLEKYQNGSAVDFIPSITNIFSQGLGIAPNISNPNGNPFGSNPFGGQLTNNIFNTGQDLQGLFGQEFQNQKPMSYSDWLKKGNRNDDLISKTMYQAYEKVFNKQLEDNKTAFEQATPLVANMTALDELNKMSTLEYNKGLKRDFSDVSNDPRGMESRGIFQSGGNPKEKVFPSIQEFMNKKAEFVNKYTDEAEKRQELLRQRLAFYGLPEDKIEEVLEIIFTEIPDDLDNDKPEKLQNKLVERIKNETGYFLPNAQKEVTDIFKLDNIYRTTMGDFNDMRLQMENPTEAPKKLSDKKFKFLKQGGTISPLQQALGYKDNSPYRSLPFQTINSNSITMDGVSIPLEVTSNTGERRILQPNSGLHVFKGASSVTEVPLAQDGGIPILNLSGKTNPLRLNPQGMYKFGGLITEGSEYNKRKQPKKNPISGASSTGPMGPKDVPSYDSGIRAIIDQEENEIIPTDNLIPIQTEIGELIILPTGDVVPVMAKKRHKQMEEDEVTDIAPEGAYILSAHGRVKIKKDEADRVITETGIKPYRLGQGQDAPTEKTLADMMNKKEMSPADVGRVVSQKFPVVATSNPYEAAANTENKINRKPYLEGLIQLSEFDKMRKGIDTSTPEATREYRGMEMGAEEMKDGGAMHRDNIIHGFDPLTIGLITAGVQGLIGLFGANSQKNEANKAYQAIQRLAVDSAKRQRTETGLGAAAGIMGTLGQDPRVNPLVLDPTYIRQMQTRIPDQITDSIANQAYSNMPDYRNLPANQQLMGSQAAYAQALKAAGDSRLAAYHQSVGLANAKLQAMQGYADKNRQELESAKRATTLNTNQMLGNVGDRTQGYFDTQAAITANETNALVGAKLGQTNANQLAIRSNTQSIGNMIGTAGAAAYDYYSNQPTTPQSQSLNQTPLNSMTGFNSLSGAGFQSYNGIPYSTGLNPLGNGQFSTGCMFIGGQWINRITGGPC